jgi:hypothetical protein
MPVFSGSVLAVDRQHLVGSHGAPLVVESDDHTFIFLAKVAQNCRSTFRSQYRTARQNDTRSPAHHAHIGTYGRSTRVVGFDRLGYRIIGHRWLQDERTIHQRVAVQTAGALDPARIG